MLPAHNTRIVPTDRLSDIIEAASAPWPTHPDGSNKRMGEMEPGERQAQWRAAAARFALRRSLPSELPRHNTRIVFDRIPAGSYLQAGEVYAVEHRRAGDDIRLIAPDGSATYERAAAIRRAAWHVED